MLLDRIDIDAHGPLNRVEIGPLAEHMNVVLSPEGAGKTAIARFIRDSLVDREYPLGMMSSSTGRVVWADRYGMVHCRREQDGSPHGRRTVEFETRGEYPLRYDNLDHSWVQAANRTTDARLSLKSVQLPESIVDGVITDTHATNVSRVLSACVRNGLDSPETYRDLPLHSDSAYADRIDGGFRGYAYHELGAADPHGENYRHDRESERQRRLRSELADIESQINRAEESGGTYEALIARRRELHARLQRWEAYRVGQIPTQATPEPSRHHRHSFLTTDAWTGYPEASLNWRHERHEWYRRLTELHDRAESLRLRRDELNRWIHAIDADATMFVGDQRYQRWNSRFDQDLRNQIHSLDEQIVHLRRTLVEVQGVRQMVNHSRDRYSIEYGLDPAGRYLDPAHRVARFAGALDHYDVSLGWDRFYGDAYVPLHTIHDLGHRIDAAMRQIDWLLEHYDRGERLAADWYQGTPAYSSAHTATGSADILATLRAIRNDLNGISPFQKSNIPGHATSDLARCESWLVSAVDRLSAHRESLLRRVETGPTRESLATANETRDSFYRHPNWYHERARRSEELHQINHHLNHCLSEAAEVRRKLRSLPVVDPVGMHTNPESWVVQRDHWQYEAIANELRDIDARLATTSRASWLQTRRQEILQELGSLVRHRESASPLSDAASRWLVRLSGGRLRSMTWQTKAYRHLSDQRVHHDATREWNESTDLQIRIDGRFERDCPETDRALASLAIRMAAGDLLARLGKGVPLVIETPAELLQHARYSPSITTYQEYGDDHRWNSPLTAALFDYARTGRQLLVLTSDNELAGQVKRTGGRLFQLHRQQIVHPHRPIWRPQYEPENYVGPHPHTYGYPGDGIRMDPYRTVEKDLTRNESINRYFDLASYEASDFDNAPYYVRETSRRNPSPSSTVSATDLAADGTVYRDGLYHANQYTTVQHLDDQEVMHQQSKRSGIATHVRGSTDEENEPQSPFYLTVDSPIDQAPSIDAVAAARLRGLGITHVNHLMQQDSNRLSDSLGLGNTNAATIRRWQSECRLVCRVPQLRGFDARVLVGCGITDPAQLAAIHPTDLLERVQAFLATERGQRILLSGSSYELSRITSWIASAHRSVNDHLDGITVNGRKVDARLNREIDRDAFDQDRYERDHLDLDDEYDYGYDEDGRPIRSRRVLRPVGYSERSNRRSGEYDSLRSSSRRNVRRSSRASNSRSSGSSGSSSSNARSSRRSRSGSGTGQGSGRGYGTGSGNGSGRGSSSRRSTTRSSKRRGRDRDVVRIRSEYDHGERESRSYVRGDYESRDENRQTRRTRSEGRTSQQERETSNERELRFYLQRDSDVVDAPSIGPRMAERLNAIGIYTVDDLLQSDPASVAEQLDHRKVDADKVIAWQQQATFVCRVPMLRGHDAQLLVAAEVTTPEDLATWEAEDLFALIDPIARGPEGKRILRGGALPDMEEISDWIQYGKQHRALIAA